MVTFREILKFKNEAEILALDFCFNLVVTFLPPQLNESVSSKRDLY